MIELSEEVDRLRAKANSSQEGVIRSKREADLLHQQICCIIEKYSFNTRPIQGNEGAREEC